MGILLFIVFGIVIGFLARAIMPGDQKMGLVMTMILGIAGSFLGGFLGSLVTDRPVFDLHTAGFLGSLLGAIVLLVLGGTLFRGSSSRPLV